jgi:hypothetical protein
MLTCSHSVILSCCRQMVEFARYAQLATVNADHLPSVRSINMRGVREDHITKLGSVRFSTDARSTKLQEFALAAAKDERAIVELCHWFPVTREQYRLRCRVQLTVTASATDSILSSTADKLRDGLKSLLRTDEESQQDHIQFWKDHSPQSRGMFEIAPPGRPMKRAAEGDLDRYEPQDVDESKPSANFVSVILIPVRCDYLKLPRPMEDTRGQISKVQVRNIAAQCAESCFQIALRRELTAGTPNSGVKRACTGR